MPLCNQVLWLTQLILKITKHPIKQTTLKGKNMKKTKKGETTSDGHQELGQPAAPGKPAASSRQDADHC